MDVTQKKEGFNRSESFTGYTLCWKILYSSETLTGAFEATKPSEKIHTKKRNSGAINNTLQKSSQNHRKILRLNYKLFCFSLLMFDQMKIRKDNIRSDAASSKSALTVTFNFIQNLGGGVWKPLQF